MESTSITIEIFSDIVCPFCYIGKRQLEEALQDFEYKDQVHIEWKSFQLDPSIQEQAGVSLYESLSERKGWSMAQTVQISNQVATMAAGSGLGLNFAETVPANSFRAHQLLHLAKAYHLQDAMKERLFQAYFTDGDNLNNSSTLQVLGEAVGLPTHALQHMFSENDQATAVQQDLDEAKSLGISGVPFFIFDRKYAVSGAQGAAVFANALEKTLEAIHTGQVPVAEESGCGAEGEC